MVSGQYLRRLNGAPKACSTNRFPGKGEKFGGKCAVAAQDYRKLFASH